MKETRRCDITRATTYPPGIRYKIAASQKKKKKKQPALGGNKDYDIADITQRNL